jgi:hypothetical protein
MEKRGKRGVIGKPYVSETFTRTLSIERAHRLVLICIIASYLFDIFTQGKIKEYSN